MPGVAPQPPQASVLVPGLGSWALGLIPISTESTCLDAGCAQGRATGGLSEPVLHPEDRGVLGLDRKRGSRKNSAGVGGCPRCHPPPCGLPPGRALLNAGCRLPLNGRRVCGGWGDGVYCLEVKIQVVSKQCRAEVKGWRLTLLSLSTVSWNLNAYKWSTFQGPASPRGAGSSLLTRPTWAPAALTTGQSAMC